MRLRLRCHHLITALVLGLVLGACGAAAPQVKVLGVTNAHSVTVMDGPRSLVLFLEVVNPTRHELALSRLEYRLNADSWLVTRGEVALSRVVGAGSATIVEVPVKLERGLGERNAEGSIPYVLEGRIVALADHVERSWSVAARGVLGPDAVAGVRSVPQIRMRTAVSPDATNSGAAPDSIGNSNN